MSAIDLSNLLKLMQEFEQNGKALPYWLADAVNRAKTEYKQETYAEQRMMAEELEKANQPFQNRINSLFDNFELPEDFIKYKTPQLEKLLDATKQNIRQFASDMQRLTELAGGNAMLEDKAVKITQNLLDRLKNDLELTLEEKKQLNGKTIEEITEYYAQTRKDKMGLLNQSINNYREELALFEKSCQGKTQQEITELYTETLKVMERYTTQSGFDNGRFSNRLSEYETSINQVKTPPISSENITQKQLEENLHKKTVLETVF